MLYPQNGDSFVTMDSVTSLHPVYSHASFTAGPFAFSDVVNTVETRSDGCGDGVYPYNLHRETVAWDATYSAF